MHPIDTRKRTSPLWAYSVATLLVAAAVTVRLALDPLIGDVQPYAPVFLAVVTCAVRFGRGPAFAAAVLGAVAVSYFVLPPRGTFSIQSRSHIILQSINLAASLGIAYLGGSLRAARNAAQELANAAETQRWIFQSVLDDANDGIIRMDLDGRIEAFNAAAQRIFGYDPREIVGNSIFQLVPADRHDEEASLLARVARGDRVEHFETVGVTRSGWKIAVAVTVSPIRNRQGDIAGVSKIVRDISRRKEAEQELRESEERYRTLFERAPEGILIAAADGCYVDANPSICRMLGYSREELIGRRAIDILADSEHQRVASAVAAMETSGDLPSEWRYRRRDGSEMTAEISAAQLPGGRRLGMIRDVTERNEAIAALSAAEERMRFALESANVGVWDMNYATGQVRWTAVVEAQYGYAPGTYDGTFDAFIDRVHPDDRAMVLDALEQAHRTGGDFPVRHRTRWPDGTVRWVSGAGRLQRNQDGAPARAIGISMDVTEQRLLEEQFRQAQKMEAVGRLAGGVAHDFNNLLTAILGYCEMLLNDLEPGDRRRDDVAEVERAGARAAAPTRQLLAFSRKQLVEPVVLDLNAVVREMQPMLQRLIGEDIKVEARLSGSLAPIYLDRGQIEQVVMNLAVNARDAMPLGGTLRIETANVEVDGGYAVSHFAVPPGQYVRLTVSDSGVGMAPEVQARLFEPFFTTKPVGKGTGLGLATVHGIVTGAGGAVDVSSELRRGTSFRIYLPPADDAQPVVEVAAAAAMPDIAGHTVLVVEDAQELRALTKRMLERCGCSVLIAEHPEDAMRTFARNEHIDLVLTDVVMPGMSGADLAEQLAAIRPGLHVVYMSGYSEEAISRHGVLHPGVAFVQKPFTAETLARKIRDVLDSDRS